MYKYNATLVRVIDGDTVIVSIDLGFNLKNEITVRLMGINTPEVYGVKKDSDEYVKGKLASQFTIDWFESLSDKIFVVKTHKDDKEKYGRYLAEIFSLDEKKCLNEDLVSSNNAKKVIYG